MHVPTFSVRERERTDVIMLVKTFKVDDDDEHTCTHRRTQHTQTHTQIWRTHTPTDTPSTAAHRYTPANTHVHTVVSKEF